jgi:hypothetical protein
MNIRFVPKIISIDIIFCGLQKKQFTTKDTQKAKMKILSYISYAFSRKQKLSFYFIKTFVWLLCLGTSRFSGLWCFILIR